MIEKKVGTPKPILPYWALQSVVILLCEYHLSSWGHETPTCHLCDIIEKASFYKIFVAQTGFELETYWLPSLNASSRPKTQMKEIVGTFNEKGTVVERVIVTQ